MRDEAYENARKLFLSRRNEQKFQVEVDNLMTWWNVTARNHPNRSSLLGENGEIDREKVSRFHAEMVIETWAAELRQQGSNNLKKRLTREIESQYLKEGNDSASSQQSASLRTERSAWPDHEDGESQCQTPASVRAISNQGDLDISTYAQ